MSKTWKFRKIDSQQQHSSFQTKLRRSRFFLKPTLNKPRKPFFLKQCNNIFLIELRILRFSPVFVIAQDAVFFFVFAVLPSLRSVFCCFCCFCCVRKETLTPSMVLVSNKQSKRASPCCSVGRDWTLDLCSKPTSHEQLTQFSEKMWKQVLKKFDKPRFARSHQKNHKSTDTHWTTDEKKELEKSDEYLNQIKWVW